MKLIKRHIVEPASPKPAAPPGRWQLAAASVTGVGHERVGMPCQDAHRWRLFPDGVLVAAVADGAGSAGLSQFGSAAVTEAVIDYFGEDDTPRQWPREGSGWLLLLANILEHARDRLELEAGARNASINELATTLLVVIATPELLAVAQIGDGAVVAGDDAGIPFTITAPQSGEYLNETIFLTSRDALASVQYRVHYGEVRRVAAMTDGLQMLALSMPSAEAYEPFFQPLFRFVAGMHAEGEADEQLARFLTSPRMRDRADDDLTLLLAAYIEGESSDHSDMDRNA